MARHLSRKDPRAHWMLLLLSVLVLLCLLTFNGYATGVLGGSGKPQAPSTSDGFAPPEVLSGGPVVRIDGNKVQSRAMPDKTIALTFDDGPDPQWTPLILDVLRKHKAKATFFVVGARVNENPELTRRILAEGHEIGSHTFTHTELAKAAQWRRGLELTLTANAIAGATGKQTTLFRPPFSAGPDALTQADYQVLREASAAGYVTVLTDLDTKDWKRPGTKEIVTAATPKKNAGAVVLMHDGGGDRTQTIEALNTLLPALTAKGYRFSTVTGALEVPTAMVADNGTSWRGDALRLAQTASRGLSSAMGVLLGVALVLAVARLVLQMIAVRVHLRRVRRRWQPGRREILDPVSVIVPAYNEAANIAATVRSLVESDYPYLEIIVVDDGSSDGTADIVERLGYREVRVVRQPNGGKPTALNTGIRMARGRYLVLVDGDTVFERGTVYNLVQGFADREVGAIAGNTKVANRKGFLGSSQHIEYVIGFNLDRRLFDIANCMPTIPGAIGAFRAEVLHEVAGVPTDTLAEDTDLTMAIIRAGWRVTYEEHAIAWTEAPATLRQLWRQRYRWCYGTMQAMWKHRRSIIQRGGLGRRGLPYLLMFQILLPLAAPAVDVFALYGLVFLPWQEVLLAWAGLLGLQGLAAVIALRLDKESLRPLWSLVFQQFVYRQLMYLVVVQSTVTALVGSRLRWHRMARTGSAAALMEPAETRQ